VRICDPKRSLRGDASAVRVVLGIGRGDDQKIERQADQMSPDLDVPLLHDVEEPHLDALGEVGQLVQDEDAPVSPREQAVVDGELVGEVPALGDLDRIDLADQVGDRDVGRGELLPVPALSWQPHDRGAIAQFRDELAPGLADRLERVVVDLAARERGDGLVQQHHQRARQPALGLAALAEQDQVLAGEQRVLDLGKNGVVEADDPVEELLAALDLPDEVLPDLGLDGAWRVT
jgi:hypothetical protein